MNTQIKIIKNTQDYEESLALLEELMSKSPEPESEEGEKLAILATLIESYESKTFPTSIVDPIDAILFRMDQLDLKDSDLIPYIGSKSRVSEVLSRKRKLTVKMMQALQKGLSIPANVLLNNENTSDEDLFDWDASLTEEMQARGCFNGRSLVEITSEVVKVFLGDLGLSKELAMAFRKTHYRATPLTDKRALVAWAACVLQKAAKAKLKGKYETGIVDLAFMSDLAKLSSKKNSPALVQDALNDIGIPLIIEPHFKKTALDGATFFLKDKNPVIGMTLRHDRLDNFWFTLMHELAHIALHANKETESFFDELDPKKGDDVDAQEIEADELASEALVPSSVWEINPARLVPSPLAANTLAEELSVHVAIIAGKIRHEGNQYQYLNQLITPEKVRDSFPEVKWIK